MAQPYYDICAFNPPLFPHRIEKIVVLILLIHMKYM